MIQMFFCITVFAIMLAIYVVGYAIILTISGISSMYGLLAIMILTILYCKIQYWHIIRNNIEVLHDLDK